MGLFDNTGTNAAYDRYLNPPDVHELDACANCHEAGDHENRILVWKETCELCEQDIAKKLSNVVMEFVFKPADIERALFWAKSKGHDYSGEKVEHLIHDAMLAGAIHAEKWGAL